MAPDMQEGSMLASLLALIRGAKRAGFGPGRSCPLLHKGGFTSDLLETWN